MSSDDQRPVTDDAAAWSSGDVAVVSTLEGLPGDGVVDTGFTVVVVEGVTVAEYRREVTDEPLFDVLEGHQRLAAAQRAQEARQGLERGATHEIGTPSPPGRAL